MGKIKKESLLLLTKKFEKVNETIEQTQQVDSKALADCQSGALDLGNYIEHFYRDLNITDLIHKLEEYCERLYLLTVTEQPDEIVRITANIKEILFSIENDMQAILPEDKKVIVFLPYKASMWDSLESIYLAAKEDEGCEAYVVPIPYFDRKPDGSLGQMHYEGNEFPENIPITFWQKYSIREERPDAVFIHNPYDQYNYVTSVHPAFYSREIKKCTDFLVYVPYFISGICFNDPKSISKSKPYHLNPGAMIADLIVVHSEVVKIAMVRSGYSEDKVQVLGTPKIDAIVHAMKEGVSIPESWKHKIQNRKIILYNTSITNFLDFEARYKRDMLDVIEDNIKYLAGEEDFSLIWRPHPLLEQTIISMRPDKLERYRSIKEIVQSSSKDILDETSSPLTSMLISDAMISDFSSLMKEYLATGKPVLVLSGSGHSKPKYRGVDLSDFYYSNDGYDVHKLCEMLRENTDEHRDDRLMAFEKSYVNFDGTAGEKIWNYVMNKLNYNR